MTATLICGHWIQVSSKLHALFAIIYFLSGKSGEQNVKTTIGRRKKKQFIPNVECGLVVWSCLRIYVFFSTSETIFNALLPHFSSTALTYYLKRTWKQHNERKKERKKSKSTMRQKSPGIWSLEFTSPRNDSSPCALCAHSFSHLFFLSLCVCVTFLFQLFFLSSPFANGIRFCFVFVFSSCRSWKLTVRHRNYFFHVGSLHLRLLFFLLCTRHTVCAFVQWNIVSFSGRKKIIMCSKTWKRERENGNKFSYEARFVLYVLVALCVFCWMNVCVTDSNAFYAISLFLLALNFVVHFVLLLLNNVWLRAKGTFSFSLSLLSPLPLFFLLLSQCSF